MFLFGNLHKKPNTILGLDIDESQINLAELTGLNKKTTLTHQASIPYNAEIFSEGVLQDIDEFIETLRPHLKSYTAKQVVLGLPSHLVNIRQVTVDDDLTPDDIEENIGFEAERALPIPLEEIYFDYWPTESQEEGKLNFIMVTCPSNIITSRIKALAELKINVVKVTINDYALANFTLEADEDDETSALIYFRQDTASIMVVPQTESFLCDHSTFKDHNIRDTMQTLWDLIHIQQQQLSIQKLYISGHLYSDQYDLDQLTNHFQCSILEFDSLSKNKLITKKPILPTSLLAIALAHEMQS